MATYTKVLDVEAVKFDGRNFDEVDRLISDLGTSKLQERVITKAGSTLVEKSPVVADDCLAVHIVIDGAGSLLLQYNHYLVKRGDMLYTMSAKEFEANYVLK